MNIVFYGGKWNFVSFWTSYNINIKPTQHTTLQQLYFLTTDNYIFIVEYT